MVAEENWRPVTGFENLYQVSDLGRVRRLPVPRYCGGGRYARVEEKIWRGYVDTQGYYSVNLTRSKKITVHRLVCEAFHGPPPQDKRQVAHFDGDKLNNRADNLRWANAADNKSLDAKRLGETCAGERAWKARLSDTEVRQIRKEYDAASGRRGAQSDIARRHNLDRGHVSAIVNRRLWSHI